MKSVLKVCNINTVNDVVKIKTAISNNSGVVACQINREKGEVSVVYDDYFIDNELLIQSIEDLGYAVF
ncbi:heavy-metal-associated domain-containing protein [Clostridium sp. JN-1]|jgi:copper chaperone CopZ|uniref:heavy-metal-associated domain-containing protein n=1 Tax=Clostridium sp. JN-1 TaxID=2483110 RepID=UPI000F0BA016|nr:heavy-metal-associated domain-containing protein [Clostridium sp. JN-1]